MKSKIVAISAISAGFIAICLIMGAYIELIDIAAVIMSSVFVLLPLYYNSYKGCLLSFLAGGIIAFMISGFNIFSLVFPSYFAFFGIYPLVQKIMTDKKMNKYLAYGIGVFWFVAFAYGIYFYYTAFMGMNFNDLPWNLSQYIYYIVGGLAVVFYFVFDRFIFVSQIVVGKVLKRIVK